MRNEPDPGALDKIEERLRLKNVLWVDPKERAFMLGSKIHALLAEVMRRHGWKQLGPRRDEDNNALRWYYAPVNPEKSNLEILPTWLPWEILNLEKPDRIWTAQVNGMLEQKDVRKRCGLGWKAEDSKIADIANQYWLTS